MKYIKNNKLVFFAVVIVLVLGGFFIFNFNKLDVKHDNSENSEETISDLNNIVSNVDSEKQKEKEENSVNILNKIVKNILPTPVPTITSDLNNSQDSEPQYNPPSSIAENNIDICDVQTKSSYDNVVLGDTPVLYYPFNEDLQVCDYSGNYYSGSKFDIKSITSLPNGDKALVFDGSHSYVEVADNDNLSPATTGKFTFEAWLRPDVLQFTNEEGSGYVHWMGKGHSGQQEFLARMYSLVNDENRPNRISGYAFNQEGGLGVGSYFQDSITAGDWIHYTFVINTADTSVDFPMGYTKIYKNGSLRDTDDLSSLSIVPKNTVSPFRIGTRDFKSFFEGAIGKVALYNYELSPFQVLEHYQTMVPVVAGSATFVRHVGSATTKTTGTTLAINVSNDIPAGDTLIVRVLNDYTAGAPTVTDSKGNTYTRDRTARDSNFDMRASLYSAPLTTGLSSGDIITVTFSSTAAKVATVDQFHGILTSSPLDQNNGTSGSSTTPGTSISITTTQEDQVIIGFAAIEGPTDDSYTEDQLGQYTTLTRVGTTGGDADTNLTINSGYKSLEAIDTYQYKPTLGTSRDWILFIASYKASP